jgi:hypothetical protein
MPQTVKFVDRPGGTVLLDVSPGSASGIQLGEGGLQAPPPPVERSLSANPVGDGATVTSQPFGMRTVRVPLAYTAGVRATTALEQAARRTAATTLMRVITRERFWIEVIADGATEARWLSCYRVTDEKAMAAIGGLGSRWMEYTLEVLADPFAVGPKETLSALTHNVAGDFKQTIAGSGIKGDVPAPCVVAFTPASDTLPRTVWMASKVGGALHKCIVGFDTLTNGTAPAGTTFTAGSADATRAIGGTLDLWNPAVAANPVTILAGDGPVITTPAGTAGMIDGQYRVFLIAPVAGTDDALASWRYDLRLVTPLTGLGAEVTLSSVTTARDALASNTSRNYDVIDFGVVDIPHGGRPPAVGYDAPATTSPATMRVYATRLIGGTNVQRAFDVLLVLPADDTMMNLQFVGGSGGRVLSVDPITGHVVVQAAGVNDGDAARIEWQGVTPYVVPGVDVDVFAFQHRGGVGVYAPLVTDVNHYPVTWTPSYWPRYLMVV